MNVANGKKKKPTTTVTNIMNDLTQSAAKDN
jgi:hypothetical protein